MLSSPRSNERIVTPVMEIQAGTVYGSQRPAPLNKAGQPRCHSVFDAKLYAVQICGLGAQLQMLHPSQKRRRPLVWLEARKLLRTTYLQRKTTNRGRALASRKEWNRPTLWSDYSRLVAAVLDREQSTVNSLDSTLRTALASFCCYQPLALFRGSPCKNS
jgi:hypothetical protein